ncbi:TonB-dependent receptor [Methyloversatilis thermotolerans]|uniref:TonB-dependent receptor n=1 Tax=Methyloversatilis thermotolerans TaxID=1346290 RepID=UPI00037B8EF6|nr:TonB-dependent receptor [Methyloversatilis thermotolerans]
MKQGSKGRTPGSFRPTRLTRALMQALCLPLVGIPVIAQAHEAAPVGHHLDPVAVEGHYDNAVGTSDAASQGSVTARLIENRPTLRPAEILEFVPGVIVTQHSGGGKANQYFLRGFNLDHGTDFATWVDGMPVNMPTHAHGHGYTDLNWLIPELVERIDYRKGPYYAEEGDFSSAGSARLRLRDRLDAGMAEVTLGEDGYRRALMMNSHALATGTLLYALETSRNDGPWTNPEDFRRVNGVLRYTLGEGAQRTSITAMAYTARWDSTDQVPLRALQSGQIGRYDAIDPTDGGRSRRYSLSVDSQQLRDDGVLRVQAYAIRSELDLWSNFTYVLDNDPDGDQFRQSERRNTYGGAISRSWDGHLGGRAATHTLGVQLRHDRLDPVGLYSTVARRTTSVTQESRVRQTSVGVFGETSVQWNDWLRSVAGLRFDRYDFDVDSSIAANSGDASDHIASPKLSLIFGPWSRTEYFLNYGFGFHSNDARGTTARVTPGGDPAQRVDALARGRGGELGVRTEVLPDVQSSLALWQLNLDSELLFVGDAGETEATRASRRQGIEWSTRWTPQNWLLFDLDISLSRARFTNDDPAGDRVPGAAARVIAFGASLTDSNPWARGWFGHLQVRHIGPRDLVEDGSVKSDTVTLAYLRVGRALTPSVRLMLDVYNLFDSKDNDIEYYYTSRLAGEAAGGVDDRHIHPVEPRTLRLTLNAKF